MTAEIDDPSYPLVWHWKTKPIGRPCRGERCRIVASGRLNSVLVEFQDGWRVLTSRYAVRRPR